MLARLAELQKDWRAQAQPVLDIGIGLNTGVASVGNMGSSMRLAYTAMGDAGKFGRRVWRALIRNTARELSSANPLIKHCEAIEYSYANST